MPTSKNSSSITKQDTSNSTFGLTDYLRWITFTTVFVLIAMILYFVDLSNINFFRDTDPAGFYMLFIGVALFFCITIPALIMSLVNLVITPRFIFTHKLTNQLIVFAVISLAISIVWLGIEIYTLSQWLTGLHII